MMHSLMVHNYFLMSLLVCVCDCLLFSAYHKEKILYHRYFKLKAFNCLPNNNILDQSNLKAFADIKI